MVGSSQWHEVHGRKVLGRRSTWGLVEVENKAHNDFACLRDMLIRCVKWGASLQGGGQDSVHVFIYVIVVVVLVAVLAIIIFEIYERVSRKNRKLI